MSDRMLIVASDTLSPLCTDEALPDGWHTPTGEVTVLDPVPCERPTRLVSNPCEVLVPAGAKGHTTVACGPCGHEHIVNVGGIGPWKSSPAGSWWADLDAETAVRLTEGQ